MAFVDNSYSDKNNFSDKSSVNLCIENKKPTDRH